jgi:hypothetical protein
MYKMRITALDARENRLACVMAVWRFYGKWLKFPAARVWRRELTNQHATEYYVTFDSRAWTGRQ